MPRQRLATETIPEHLAPFIVEQDPSLYTAIDHASWRFILRISRKFFAKHAHQKYLDGLVETGISTERIPLVSEMDLKLRQFGWRAIAVSGFIPPAAFMEFQSLGILPIACDMRKLENLAYTPAPDIVHEAAGHAPIIADPEYSNYLRNYGEVSRKAILSHHDIKVYQAIRNLSEVKENPDSTPEAIAQAQAQLDEAVDAVDFDSEAALLARMNWWTVEYVLVGPVDHPKIYGAGLLSSVGESYNCLGDGVKKIPLTVGCVEQPYDITRPQPQLFVTPNFHHLTTVLNEFAATMAFKRGGTEALDKAIQAGTVTTTELDSKIQIGGKLAEYLKDSEGRPSYLRYSGPSQLAFAESELEAQGARHHREGFGTPIGKLVWKDSGGGSIERNPQDLTDSEASNLTSLEFASGVKVTGKVTGLLRRGGKLILLTWKDCRVVLGDRVLFDPAWGVFDMACGTAVESVFGGAPDRSRYLRDIDEFPRRVGFQKTNLTDENLGLNRYYEEVRRIRETSTPDGSEAGLTATLGKILDRLDEEHPNDWLLRWEILELDHTWKLKSPWRQKLLGRLATIAAQSLEKEQLIRRALELLA
jgi:phenylalanine-4-hydroxylase